MSKLFTIALAIAGLVAGASAPALATTGQAGDHAAERPISRAAATSQRFVMSYVTVNGKDRPSRVVAAGPIHGKATIVDTPIRETKDGVVLKSVITLPHGTVTLKADEKYAVSMHLRSCTAKNVGKGTWKIVSGTGAYGHASGSGTFVRRTFIVGAFDAQGRCLGQSAVPAAETGTLVITGSASR
jgi:hypothetical protein